MDEVEFDVQLTRDGVPIVIHDETLDRTTALRGRVDAHDWATIRAGAPSVPSLDALCGWASTRTVGLMLELKQPDGARDVGLVPAVLPILRRHGVLDRTVSISFDHPSVAQLLALEPAARAGLLYGGTDPRDWLRGVAGIHPHHRWVTPALCARAHADGLYVHAWGFDPTAEDVRRLVDAGADSLSADDPRALVAVLR